MRLIREDNIANTIIFVGLFMLASLMALSSYYFISKQSKILKKEVDDSRDAFVLSQKKLLKQEVNHVLDIIRFKEKIFSNGDEKRYKNEIKEWVRDIRFGEDNENYFVIYKIEDFKGGDNFAKMVVNPNRVELEGKYLSLEHEDDYSRKFRKLFLQEINIHGHAYVNYMYKKLNSKEVRPKISYCSLYLPWGWVIGAGAYLDGVNHEIELKEAAFTKHIQEEITSAIFIFLLFSLVAIEFAVWFGKKIEKVLKNRTIQLQIKKNELKKLNKELAQRVNEEVQKNIEQEQLLIQKSKFIALGEMISNIAHQWRQPLCELSAILMMVKFKHKLGVLDDVVITQKSRDAEALLEYMSKTIDDFRDFFMPSREKQKFFAQSAIDAVINIIGTSIKEQNINLQIEIPKDQKIYAHKNEFEQVILNIITNAKNILVLKKPDNPTIQITLKSDKTFTYLIINDNGGGVQITPIEKIFQPYFTTTQESGGTGIGLYMSKLIIEKSMDGDLTVQNSEKGAKFTIRLKKID